MTKVLEQAVESGERQLPEREDRELRTEGRSNPLPDLLLVSEAAKMLRVSDATVRNWIRAGCIPYVTLPSPDDSRHQTHRIPLRGLLNSLDGTYDLREALVEQNERMRAADLPED